MGVARLLLAAATSPLVFRAWTWLVAGDSGGCRRQGIAGKEGPCARALGVEMLCSLLACSLGPAPQTPALAVPRCPASCEQGEASPSPLVAEAESPACYVSCLTITAALTCSGMRHVGCDGPYNLPGPHILKGMSQHLRHGAGPHQAPAMIMSPCDSGGLSTAVLGLFL